jgi:hypothetical protein
MRGWWIGAYTETSNGTIIVNIDEYPSCYQGIAYLHNSDSGRPGFAGSFRTPSKERKSQIRTDG